MYPVLVQAENIGQFRLTGTSLDQSLRHKELNGSFKKKGLKSVRSIGCTDMGPFTNAMKLHSQHVRTFGQSDRAYP